MINYAKIIRETIKECEVLTGVKCEVPIFINERLTKCLGRASAKILRNRVTKDEKIIPTKIEFSQKFIEVATEKELIDVVRHEFAHYCVYKTKGLHDHYDTTYVNTCKKIDCNHAPSTTLENEIKYKYEVRCSCCNNIAGKYSKASTVVNNVREGSNRYKSSCCNAKLTLKQNW